MPKPANSMFLNFITAMVSRPVAELQFAPPRKWRFDWSWPEHLLALEVEGGIWAPGGGRHNRAPGMLRDMEKYNAAACLGWRILRVTPDQLLTTATVQMIRKALDNSAH